MNSPKRKHQSSIESKKHKITKTTNASEFTMTVTIAVSSCALFTQETAGKGAAFPFVKALAMVNQRLTKLGQATEERFEIVLITTGNQDKDHLTNNIEKYNLDIDRVCEITGEKTLLDRLNEIKPVLYLSTNLQNVREAINAGYGAAIMTQRDYHEHSDMCYELRVAFDGDGVLFSDESERVYKEKGIQAFLYNEIKKEDIPLKRGPLSKFFQGLVHLQLMFKQNCPIRTYLITSRGTPSPGLRALKTLKGEKLEINEAFFLSGAPKGPVLKAIKPHIFFDDQISHVMGALENGVIGAHVPYGVRNE